MKTMNGITNELLVKKARKNWKTRCGAFLLAAIATLYGGQAAFGVVTITTGAGNQLATNWNFATTPTQGAPGPNAGGPGQNAHTEYAWQGPTGTYGTYDSLNYLANGMTVNTTGPNGATGTHTLNSGDSITINSGEVMFTSSLNWSASAFTVTGSGGTIYALGGDLNLNSRLNNSASLTISDITPGTGVSGNSITVSGGTNTGNIYLDNTIMNLNGNLGGGNVGTIQVGLRGQLNVATNNVGNNIDGSFTGATNTRSLVSISGTSNLNGYLSGSIALTGGGRAHITANNTGVGPNGSLSKLTVLNGTVAQIDNQNNLGTAPVALGSGGILAKHRSVGDLTITNNVNIGVLNDSGELLATGGGLSSNVGSVIPWNENADDLHDAGRRFIISGILSSTFLDSMVAINSDLEAFGTVVLANSANTYKGSFDVYKGVLEVSSEGCLGLSANDVNKYSINLGGTVAGSYTDRPTFRVVGGKKTSQTIAHSIQLNADDATYEVFTTSVSSSVSGTQGQLFYDKDGNPIQVSDGTPYYDINGNPIWMEGSMPLTERASLADRDRFTVHQVGLVTGAYDLNKAGDGVLSLECANNYTGDTVIWHGVLRINSAENINNNKNAKILIGGNAGYETTNFRPVFETTLGKWDTNKVIINASVMVNQTNSIIRTTGLGNETVINGKVGTEYVSGYDGSYAQYDAVLIKDGAGTLTLHGTGEWGAQGAGELQIMQGTVQFNSPKSLSKGYITIGTDPSTYKDLETIDNYDTTNNVAVPYKATLKLEANSGDVAIGNQIILATPRSSSSDNTGSFIEVGAGSKLTLTSTVREAGTANGSDLNKAGDGELVLTKGNSFTGWTKVFAGALTTTETENNLINSLGVDLIGKNTSFNLAGADQWVQNLKGGDATADPNELNPANWTRSVNIGNNKLVVATTLTDSKNGLANVLYGNITSGANGILSKQGTTNSTLAAGFDGFQGGFDIQSGDIRMLTDADVTSLTGKTGSHLDLYGNTLTVDIGSNYQYSGTIVNTLPNQTSAGRYGTLVKTGAGTLTTNFTEFSSGRAFNGSVTLEEGRIKSTSDFTMAAGNTMTFYVHTDANGSVTPLVFDISGYRANFSAASTLDVLVGDATTGWSDPTGRTILGEIDGNDTSNYDGLKTSTTNSLFLSFDKEIRTSAGRRDLLIVANVGGFAGIGESLNEVEVGTNLDGIRTQNLTGNPDLANIFKALWAAGSNVTTDAERAAQSNMIRGIYRELSGDVIANANYMGLDSPWKRPFDRLNLDSQMVYVHPQQRQYRPMPAQAQQYRGQAPLVANMRNIWFTPTYQGVSVRSDGNARGFNIERPGFQLGWDKRVAPNASVGLMLGYSSPSLHQNYDIVDAADFQCGIYGGAMVGYFVEVKGFIGFGHQNYKSTRTVDLRPIGMPTQSAHGTFDGDTFNFSLEVARPLFLGFSVLRPIIGIDSEHAYRYAFAETGDAIAMRYGRSSISRTRMRFALDLETCTLERMIWHGRIGYSANLGGKDYAETTAQFINVYSPEQTIRGVAVGTSYFEAGVGVKYFLNPAKTLSLVADYDASIANRWAEHRGVVGITYVY